MLTLRLVNIDKVLTASKEEILIGTETSERHLAALCSIVGQIRTSQVVRPSGVVYLRQWWRESEVFDSEQTGSRW